MLETRVFLQGYQESLLKRVELPQSIRKEYRLTECLREGDDREVYLAEGKDGTRYILKIRTVGRPDSLRNEYEMLRTLSHPQLPQVITWLEENGREYLVRTCIPGRSLQDMVSQEGILPENRAAGILLSLCEVLQYLHEQKPAVIHRDIKPQNIILTPEGKCALIDFGTARRYRNEAEEDTVFMGTPAVAPPEQFGYGQTDERTDIYAAGMLLRFLRTGRLDRPKKEEESPAYRIIEKKCTSFAPEKRFGKVRSLARALRFFLYRKSVVPALTLTLASSVLLTAALTFHNAGAEVHFQSSLLEQAVREELRLAADTPIPRNRLGEISQLIICGNETGSNWSVHGEEHDALKNDSTLWSGRGDVGGLKELDRLTNLEILVLDYQNISDITPLKGKKLKYVSLCGNRIADISALENMDTLEKLWIEDNPVSDADILSTLDSLYELVISGTDITDAESFSGLPLKTLDLRDTLITDLTPLKKLRGIQFLKAGEVNEQGLITIQSMQTLTFLAVSSRMKNLEGFSGLPRLNMLDVSNSRLESLEGVEKLPKLDYFGFGYTKPVSLEPLTLNDAIRTVEMVGAKIEDYSPLLRCRNLRTVHVGFSQEKEAEKQLGNSALEILSWEE